MKKPLILLALVAGCGASDPPPDHAAGRNGATELESAAASASLTGLYEGGSAAAPNQLCIVEKDKAAEFGLVVWGANLSACSGAGTVERDGDRVRLRMTGDQACTLEARMRGGSIVVEGPVAPGCAYYCGARAGFDGARFDRKGSSTADAMKAKDPAGDSLCSS